MFKTKNLMYYLLTAATFYLVAFVLQVPSVGPVPAPWVKALLFVAVHVLVHRLKKAM